MFVDLKKLGALKKLVFYASEASYVYKKLEMNLASKIIYIL